MKLSPDLAGTCRTAAFVLVDHLVAASVFGITVAGLIYVQMFGLRLDQLLNSKSGAAEMARMSFNDLNNDIRAAKIWAIGTGNASTFVQLTNGAAQQGTALQLSLTTDTNSFIRYYFDTNTYQLVRFHSGDAHPKIIASSLTNSMYFKAEDPSGNTQTNLTHKGVIHVVMQFARYQYPLTKIGPGYYYDFFEMNYRATPHVPDGL